MKRKDVEKMVGESMDDMGLVEHFDERECEGCGHLLEDHMTQPLCLNCQLKQ